MVRVSKKRIIVVEEVYENVIRKYVTYINDWIVNKIESIDINVPFHFHTEQKWLSMFEEYGCRVIAKERVSSLPFWPPVLDMMYILEKEDTV
jgi:hypothetical protein